MSPLLPSWVLAAALLGLLGVGLLFALIGALLPRKRPSNRYWRSDVLPPPSKACQRSSRLSQEYER